MGLETDLLHPSRSSEKRNHKMKRLTPRPDSYYIDVKCPGCFAITTVFTHSQSVVVCSGCNQVLCTPTGGRCRLTEDCSWRPKPE